jgi:hypothetical protein
MNKEKYLILEYTNVFFQPKFCSKSNMDIFNSKIEWCKYRNCEYTCDKTKIKIADALIFHMVDILNEYTKDSSNFEQWLKNTRQLPYKSVEEKVNNNPEQIWIMWNDESIKIDERLNVISNLFNWTLSYKTDSEVYEGAYGLFKPKKELSDESARKKFINSKPQRQKELYDSQFKSRQNATLWFVSNCKSATRLQIALRISKHYPVHVFGNCDPASGMSEQDKSKLYPFLKTSINSECKRDSECERKLLMSYKYYLAFENRNCSDYITEKLWRAFSNQLIPIVMQPSRDSYTRQKIPSQAIIHLQDFDYDAERLTSYLKTIDNDFSIYYNHIKWTSHYLDSIYLAQEVEPHRMCHLCKKLNEYSEKIYYKNLAKFFSSKCL